MAIIEKRSGGSRGRVKRVGRGQAKAAGNGRMSREELLNHLQTFSKPRDRYRFLEKNPHYDAILSPGDYEAMAKPRIKPAPAARIRISSPPTEARGKFEEARDRLLGEYGNLGGSEAHDRLTGLAKKGDISPDDLQLLKVMNAKAELIRRVRAQINEEIRKTRHGGEGYTTYITEVASKDKGVMNALAKRNRTHIGR